jgi:fatty aldehyde decarbonylase
MAIDNYSEMMPLITDTDDKIETVQQASDEAKHVRMLAKLGSRLDCNVKQQIIEPQWRSVRKHFAEAVQKGHLASCLIIQDLMVETMAIVLYRTLGRNTDPETVTNANLLLKDEMKHLDIGVDRIKRLLDKDPDHVHDCLAWSHNRVMPELFSLISYSCESLCDELNVECNSLRLENIKTNLDDVKTEALDTYMESLDKVGFGVRVVTPLIASMSAYGVQPRADLSLRSDSNSGCCPSPGGSCC